MSFGNLDSDFDRYRKQRVRFKNAEPAESSSQYDNSTLRELEQVEAREIRDQQLTREVHDFFADATRQAATIVERMAHDAEAEADVKIENEMESFLLDTFARMNGFVMNMLKKRKMGNTAETKLEPKVGNLVGQTLDEFRWEGTADVPDRHIGQDPFDTDLDEVRREFRTHVSDEMMDDDAATPIEDHLVADVAPEDGDAATEVDADPEAGADETPAGSDEQTVESASDSQAEIERFKMALKSLVRQGTMTRDEARAAWATRLRSLGLDNGRS